jgi:hypothetical protein
MTNLSTIRSVAAGVCAAALLAAGASACSSHAAGTGTSTSSGGGTLTIQGDTGNPTLVENFNPFQPKNRAARSRLTPAARTARR